MTCEPSASSATSAVDVAQTVGGGEVVAVALGVKQGARRSHPVDGARPPADRGLAQLAVFGIGVAAEPGPEQFLHREGLHRALARQPGDIGRRHAARAGFEPADPIGLIGDDAIAVGRSRLLPQRQHGLRDRHRSSLRHGADTLPLTRGSRCDAGARATPCRRQDDA